VKRSGAVALIAALGAALGSFPAIAGDAPPPGASSCSGCHAPPGKVATDVPTIMGRNAAELVTALDAFRSGERQATVMGRIVKGFSPEEVRAIAAWLAAQKQG
jgi:cytochrome subunit of sulfide dehydrogenase